MTAAAAKQIALPWHRQTHGDLTLAAWLYWAVIVVPAATALVVGLTRLHNEDWSRFTVLLALASVSQLLSFHLHRSRVFHTGIAFTVAAALLLRPELIILVCVLQHLPEWLRQRYPWYIQTFNIANYVAAGLGAWAAAQAVGFPASGEREALAGALAALTFVVINRLFLLPMLTLARGLAPRETGLFNGEDIALELVLSLMAVPFAAIWARSLPLAALSLVPLFVVHITQRAVLRLEEASDEIEDAHEEVKRRSTATLEALSATVDARDKYTAGHSRRVAAYAAEIAQHLGLPDSALDVIGQAALLHDIGKIGVPDAVLLKRGELTQTEELVMQSHSEAGARIIERLGYLDDVVPGIRHHHERPDGRGYPDGLTGNAIPLVARVIHVADSLDAMTTARVYRDAMSFDMAMAEIRSGRGTDFCETCVDALERAVAAGSLGVPGRPRIVAA
jgi:putative nucleotidyltransferase with HDIG domain